LLEAINGVVQKHDVLWILGDFCWGNHGQASQYRERIQCKDIRLVWGNHDHRSIEPLFTKAIEQGMVSVRGQKIWLNHYPMRSWDRAFHGSWHLYGHVHGRMSEEDTEHNYRLTRDVGVDASEYRPVGFAELESYMQPRIKAFEERKLEIPM
ncbi:MAG: metallophosphoesterase family protein, partial [Planctomycetota bacterium]